MKTIKFDCNGHNAPAYSCNKPYDNSGEYVPADVAQGLYDALSYHAKTLSDLMDDEDTGPVVRRFFDGDDVGRMRRALAAADGEGEP